MYIGQSVILKTSMWLKEFSLEYKDQIAVVFLVVLHTEEANFQSSEAEIERFDQDPDPRG